MAAIKSSAAELAYQNLKEQILSGFLLPGEKIDQDAAALKLGLSRMPIRAALDRLAADGLVIVTPHRGAVVSPLNADTLNNIFSLRAQIESYGIMQATLKASTTSIETLIKMLDYQESVADSTPLGLSNQNKEFHRAIIRLAEDKTLLGVFENLFEQSERYRRIYFRAPKSNDRIASEHRHIVELMLMRDPQAAADFMIKHTRASQEKLLNYMGKELDAQKFRLTYLKNHDL